jgi:hypothetical protein
MKEKYCDAHIHFERICDGDNLEYYDSNYFTPSHFNYIDIVERPQKYIDSLKYFNWLSEVIFF